MSSDALDVDFDNFDDFMQRKLEGLPLLEMEVSTSGKLVFLHRVVVVTVELGRKPKAR
jgi:hypothetical protein